MGYAHPPLGNIACSRHNPASKEEFSKRYEEPQDGTTEHIHGDSYVRSPDWQGRSVGGDSEGDILTEIESLLGSTFDDSLAGDHASNVLDGHGGNDRIYGHGGEDLLYGGGDDILWGGSGSDQLVGGAGSDRYIFRVRDGVDDRVDEEAGGENSIIFRSVSTASYQSTGFEFRQEGADLRIITQFDDSVVLSDFYGAQGISYSIYTESTEGELTAIFDNFL